MKPNKEQWRMLKYETKNRNFTINDKQLEHLGCNVLIGESISGLSTTFCILLKKRDVAL